MDPGRTLLAALAVVILASCGGSTPPRTEDTNVWLCDSSCVLPGRCADIQGGGAMSCAQVVGWSALPEPCSPADCTAVIDPTNHCMAVVTCPVDR